MRSAYWTELFCLATTLPLNTDSPSFCMLSRLSASTVTGAFLPEGAGGAADAPGGLPGGPDGRRDSGSDGERESAESHSLRFGAGRGAAALVTLKVAITRPRTRVISCDGRVSSPVPLTTPPER